jgi:CBS domain containing-hemolysin-like protein
MGDKVKNMKTPAARRALRRIACALLALFFPATAMAMSGPFVDNVANVLAVIVLFVVPIAAIYLFWKVHVLPELVAEKRHHPQKDAIKALCILSLFFGGLLWPFAWLWAYSKPVIHKLAYGTDKHEDFYKNAAPGVPATAQEVARLRADLERLTAMGVDADDLRAVKRALTRLEEKLAGGEQKETN